MVLRFGSKKKAPDRRSRGILPRESRRIWLLLLALGLVVYAIRHFNKPSTIEQLGMIFTPQAAQENQGQESAGKTALQEATAAQHATITALSPERVAAKDVASVSDEEVEATPDFSLVQDNASFLNSESSVWFHLFGRFEEKNLEELAGESWGEVSYTQLLHQPESYRGRVVTIRGTVLREEVQTPAKNERGIETYHRLWIRPHGGGSTPFVVYALELPARFPRGDNLRVPVVIHGYYFKNWSYAWNSQMALAPVVLAKSFDWQPPKVARRVTTISTSALLIAIGIACLVGVAVAWCAYVWTRRSPHMKHVPQQVKLPDAWRNEDSDSYAEDATTGVEDLS